MDQTLLKKFFFLITFFMIYKVVIATKKNQIIRSDKNNEYFRLKFITPYTKFPVRLKDNFGNLKNTKWFKYGSNCFVDQLDNFKKFFSFENQMMHNSNSEINLLITDFNNQSFFMLDHYEPRHGQLDQNFLGQNREIYSIVYMSKFNSQVENKNDKIEVSCVASFIYPVDLADEHSQIIIAELFNSVEISMKIQDNFRQKRLIKKFNHRVKKSINVQSVHEIDFTEGPITFYKQNLENINVSCGIKILDYDGTYALNHLITRSIQNKDKIQVLESFNLAIKKKSSFLMLWSMVMIVKAQDI